MLPLQQAREVRDSIIEYIKANFKFKEKDVSDAFYRFIEHKDDGLFIYMMVCAKYDEGNRQVIISLLMETLSIMFNRI